MKLNRLHETLFVLYKCSSTIERIYNALEVHGQKGPLYAFHHFSHNLAYYMIMESVSFLNEYNAFFTETNVEVEYGQRVKEVRMVVKPLYKKIMEWKDLVSYRNAVVAHGWRDKKSGNTLIASRRKSCDIPRSYFEFQLLKDLIKQLFQIIELEFKAESYYATWFGYSEGNEKIIQKDYSNINQELQEILNKMNSVSRSLGKNYDIQITGYTS